jgi:hypothetical protein
MGIRTPGIHREIWWLSTSSEFTGLDADISTPSGLDKAQLERKIRLLTLASLGFRNIGKDVPYATLASALQVDQSDVEKWVIDGISLLYVRTHPTNIMFSDPCWPGLRKTLSVFQSLPHYSFDLASV